MRSLLLAVLLLPAAVSAQTAQTTPPQVHDPRNPFSWAPLTKVAHTILPVDVVSALAAQDSLLELARTTPPADIVTQVIDNKGNADDRKGKCVSGRHLMSMRWRNSQAGYWGEAVNCVPSGTGIISFADGSVYVGPVTDFHDLNYPADIGKKRDKVFPVATGLGIKRTAAQLRDGGGLVAWMRPRRIGDPGFCNTCREVAIAGIMTNLMQATAVTNRVVAWFDSFGRYATNVDEKGNAKTGILHLPNGAQYTSRISNGNLVAGEYAYAVIGDNRYEGVLGERRKGGPPGIYFTGLVTETLAAPDIELGVPKGVYHVQHYAVGAVVRRTLIRPMPRTLAAVPADTRGCPKPSFVPDGWITFWPMCRPAAVDAKTGKPIPARVSSFSPNTRTRITEVFEPGGNRYRFLLTEFERDGGTGTRINANAFTAALDPVGRAALFKRNDLVFEGEFLGRIPNGVGTCDTPPGEPMGTEPCFYANGARTDEVHLARQEAKAIARENARLQAQVDADRAAEERVRRQAQIAAEQAEAEQRRARQAALDAEDEDEGPRVNPYLAVMDELRQKYSNAAAESQRGWDQVNTINAQTRRYEEQQRAQAQAAAARRAQAAADASARNAQAARDAAAITEAARAQRAAEAQARLAEAKRRVAEQQAAARSAQQPAATPQQRMAGASPAAQPGAPSSSSTAAAPIRWLEGVVVCPLDGSGRLFGEVVCKGPFTSNLNKVSDLTQVARNCGATPSIRLIGDYGGYRVFGCGTGINPTRDDRSPHKDQASAHGLLIPSRLSFRCPALQTSVCTSR